jgi:hypothetical protein
MKKLLIDVPTAILIMIVLSSLAAAKNWTKPQVLINAKYTAAANSSLNASGTAAAIWAAGPANTTLQVQARVRPSGGMWSAKIPLTKGLQYVAGTGVAVAPNNDVLAVWTVGYLPGVAQAAFYTKGKWGAPFNISLPGLDAGVPEVAFDGQSNATVVWEQSTDVSNCVTMAAVGTAATGLGTPQTIANSCNGWVRLAVNKSGEAMVVSGVSGPSSGPIIAVSRDQFGVWGPSTTISANQYLQREPSVGLGDDGTAVIAWSQRTVPAFAKRDPGGLWSPVGTIYNGTNYGGTTAVAVDGRGNAVAAFDQYVYQGGGYIYPTYATYMPLNGTWGTPVKLMNGYTVQLAVAATPAGSFVVGWADSNNFSIGASTLLPGSKTWSSEQVGPGWPFSLHAASGSAIMTFGDVVTTQVMVSTEIIP